MINKLTACMKDNFKTESEHEEEFIKKIEELKDNEELVNDLNGRNFNLRYNSLEDTWSMWCLGEFEIDIIEDDEIFKKYNIALIFDKGDYGAMYDGFGDIPLYPNLKICCQNV